MINCVITLNFAKLLTNKLFRSHACLPAIQEPPYFPVLNNLPLKGLYCALLLYSQKDTAVIWLSLTTALS